MHEHRIVVPAHLIHSEALHQGRNQLFNGIVGDPDEGAGKRKRFRSIRPDGFALDAPQREIPIEIMARWSRVEDITVDPIHPTSCFEQCWQTARGCHWPPEAQSLEKAGPIVDHRRQQRCRRRLSSPGNGIEKHEIDSATTRMQLPRGFERRRRSCRESHQYAPLPRLQALGDLTHSMRRHQLDGAINWAGTMHPSRFDHDDGLLGSEALRKRLESQRSSTTTRQREHGPTAAGGVQDNRGGIELAFTRTEKRNERSNCARLEQLVRIHLAESGVGNCCTEFNCAERVETEVPDIVVEPHITEIKDEFDLAGQPEFLFEMTGSWLR